MDCIEWTQAVNTSGYGQVSVDGRLHLAHRLAWQRAHGRSVPDGMVVMHTCDNRRCVNPAHLALGTVADNNADMRAKGRAVNPPLHAKITAADAEAIRGMVARGARQRDVAALFGIARSNVSMIVNGRAWPTSP